MTKKDYKLIAKCFRAELDTLSSDDDRRILFWLHKRLADSLKWENPNFQREAFESACGFVDFS